MVNRLSVGLIIGRKLLWDETQAVLSNGAAQVVLEQAELGDPGRLLEAIRKAAPELLILDVAAAGADLESVVQAIRSLENAPFLVAVHDTADPQSILRAMRAGANEFLYPPLETGLRQVYDKLGELRRTESLAERPGGKVLGILSVKGGCGATTIACHLAVELQKVTRRDVLLADFDLDAGLVGFLMKSKSPYNFVDAVKNVERLDLSFWKALLSNGVPGVEILAAPAGVSEREHIGHAEVRHIVRFMRAHYGWAVVDLGRGLNPVSLRTLEEVDEAFLITTLEVPTLHQTKHIIQTLLNAGFRRDRMRLVLNRSPKQSDLTPDELERLVGIPLYKILPNEYATLYEVFSDRKLAGADTRIGKHFAELAAKIAGVEQNRSRRKFSLFG